MKNRQHRQTAPAAPLEHYWLVAGQVYYDFAENAKFHRNLNCLVRTERDCFPHSEIAKAQQLLQVRLMTENFPDGPPAEFKITDVFMLSINHLGRMTPDQFAEGFAALASEQSRAAELLEKLRKENPEPAAVG